jgi:hypothetical protein
LWVVASQLNSLIVAYERDGEKGYAQRLPVVKETLTEFFKEYNKDLDVQMTEALLNMYATDQEGAYVSSLLKTRLAGANNNYQELVRKMFDETDFHNQTIVLGRLDQPASDVVNYLKRNPTILFYNDIVRTYQGSVSAKLNELQAKINKLQRTYMKAQMEVFPEKKFYPDANSTLRVTYGNVKGYEARDAVKFDHYTYLDGVMEKYKPGDYEFDVPAKLQELSRCLCVSVLQIILLAEIPAVLHWMHMATW